MKKRFAAVFAATAVLGVTTAFAANPFSDVTPNDWAYQSVSQLAAAGVINGYPDGTFKGQNNITRYEMAQMVAKAMANEARANAEQQAMINRLADEFASELNNLGVRVATLENKVGNVKVTGDVRLRYQGSDKKDMFSNSNNPNKKSKFDYRGRIQFNANVADNTSAVVRVTTGDNEFGNASASSNVKFDRVYVAHKFGQDTTLVAGRFGAFIGGGLIYDDTFDGAALAYDNGNFAATAAHGYFMAGNLFGSATEDGLDIDSLNADTNVSVTLLQAQGKLGEHATIGGFYAIGNRFLDDDIYGGHLDLQFDKVWIGGEYATWKDDIDDSNKTDAWVAGIGFGNYNIKEEGTWGVKVQYFDEAKYSPVISSTWNQPYNADYKAWMATVDYALAKNVGLSAYWAFNAEDQDGNDLSDYYRAELNYKF
ncbi:MAG: major outer membrane protein [Veillonella sp.]|uniref:putative porin n=1 Tax=Veillonella sp. TaxID=1926307 RepID=UPI0025F57D66|nr:putative porin [Veillonella sp.]MBE6080362.1 major outer membrane protein [Veillonella sp.]